MTLPADAHANAHWVWIVSAAATFGVIARPGGLPEVVWALAGALALPLLGLLPWTDALHAVGAGTDVYLFLAGMMLIAELARREGLFDFCAALAVQHARGDARRLFLLVYGIGVVVTVFMSNDATAVVLTPAVCAAVRRARVPPLPHLLACAFVANAASFVLPISNPANLVIFGRHMPPLGAWLAQFTLPSVAAIAVTWAALRWLRRDELDAAVHEGGDPAPLSASGRLVAWGLAAMAAVLLGASGAGWPLGAPTLAAALAVAALVLVRARQAPWPLLRGISWGVLGMVAGLFVLVAGLERSGAVHTLAGWLRDATAAAPAGTGWLAGWGVAVVSNIANNLPVGLLAGNVLQQAPMPPSTIGAIALGVDLGPNLSVTGSLATLLWLAALRREGVTVSAWQFLKVGAVAMPAALAAAMAALYLG